MTLIHGFIASESFYDDVHFPRGFRKSGDFNIAESELLTQVGKRLFMLEQDLCIPANQVEKQFVATCKSQFEGHTKVELLWQKYKCLTRYKHFHTLNSHKVVPAILATNTLVSEGI
ncbi:MAG: hypothetical protein ACI9LM_003068 [Alteromonadaceae bacterium]|jgi:uncharacterized protein YifE (UPF0438 family)